MAADAADKELEMNWFIVGTTFDLLGKILIGIAVLLVHKQVMKEHKIDKDVLKQMKREQLWECWGLSYSNRLF